MNNRKKMSSQEPNIPGFIDSLGDRNHKEFTFQDMAN